MKPQTLLLLAAFCVSLLTPTRLLASPPQYSVTILDGFYLGYGINDAGQVVGATGGNPNALLWSGTIPQVLAGLGGSESVARGINASGQVAGASSLAGSDDLQAVRWTGATVETLETLGGSTSQAYGINASGQTAGVSRTGSGATHAVLWTGTTATDLGTLPGGTSSSAYGVNNSGQVVGNSSLSGAGDPPTHAVRWTGATPTDLGTLPGGDSSDGYAINSAGQVVGRSNLAPSVKGQANFFHATLWTGTTATDLGTLGGLESLAAGINDSGDVVGMADNTSGSYTAFLYADGTMFDLNTLLLPGSGVTGLSINAGQQGNIINNLGQIVAFGNIGDSPHALLLTPTPEPASALLLLGGEAFLGLRRHRLT